MSLSTPPNPERQSQNQVMRGSGSLWGPKHVSYFVISPVQLKGNRPVPQVLIDTRRIPFRTEVKQQFESLSSSNLTKSTHKDLMLPTVSRSESQNFGTMLGPFFAVLATIKEAPHEPAVVARARPERERKQVQREGMVSSTSAIEPGTDSSEEENEGKEQLSDPSYSIGSSEATDKSAHLQRVKPETPTQVMFYLFCQGVFEGSNLGSRGQQSPRERHGEHRLEWSVAGKKFEIDSPRVHCVTVNDGSLFWKEFSSDGAWVTEQQSLAYCSIETKALFHQWDEGERKGAHSVKVEAQEASQMIGMMCERLRAAAKKKQRDVDPAELSEYDRTTFLISGAQRSMFLKTATFEVDYIRHFFSSCLKAPPKETLSKDDDIFTTSQKSDLSLAAQLGEMKIGRDDVTPPQLQIFVSPEFDLSRGGDLYAAAQLVLLMGSYLEDNGPLLKGISAAD